MPLVSHPVPGATIASPWGSLVADQVVTTFTTAAQRTSQLPAPEVGRLSTLDTVPGRVDVWTGTTWEPVASPPSAWTSYTPTWSAGGSSAGLALGTGGTLVGVYKWLAPYTVGIIVNLNVGSSGFNGGSGAWWFGYPPGVTGGNVVSSHAHVQGTGNPVVIGAVYLGASLQPASTSTVAGAAASFWSAAFPLTWAAGHQARIGCILNVGGRWQ